MLSTVRKFANSFLLEGGIIRRVLSIDDLHCPLLDLFYGLTHVVRKGIVIHLARIKKNGVNTGSINLDQVFRRNFGSF